MSRFVPQVFVVGAAVALACFFGCSSGTTTAAPAGSDAASCSVDNPSACADAASDGPTVAPGDDDGGGPDPTPPDPTPPADDDAGAPHDGKLGSPCNSATECNNGICERDFVDSAYIAKNGAVCTQACCVSADCPAGLVCYVAGTSPRSICVQPSNIARGAVGALVAGDACTTGASCRSGLCEGGHCRDSCCNDASCSGGTRCTGGARDGRYDFQCALPSPAATLDDGQACTSDAACKNGHCNAGAISAKTCSPPCRSSADCAALGFAGCAYEGVFGIPGIIAVCEGTAATVAGKAAEGAPCAHDADCSSFNCGPGAGDPFATSDRCVVPCATDVDCQAFAGASHCRPAAGGVLWCAP